MGSGYIGLARSSSSNTVCVLDFFVPLFVVFTDTIKEDKTNSDMISTTPTSFKKFFLPFIFPNPPL